MGVAGEKRRWVEGCPATAQLKGAQGAVDRHQQEVVLCMLSYSVTADSLEPYHL